MLDGDYCLIVTLEYSTVGGGRSTANHTESISIAGSKRSDAVAQILAQLDKAARESFAARGVYLVSESYAILFFSLEPE